MLRAFGRNFVCLIFILFVCFLKTAASINFFFLPHRSVPFLSSWLWFWGEPGLQSGLEQGWEGCVQNDKRCKQLKQISSLLSAFASNIYFPKSNILVNFFFFWRWGTELSIKKQPHQKKQWLLLTLLSSVRYQLMIAWAFFSCFSWKVWLIFSAFSFSVFCTCSDLASSYLADSLSRGTTGNSFSFLNSALSSK